MDVLFCIIRKFPRKIGEVRGIYINCANGSFLENEKFAGIRFPFIFIGREDPVVAMLRLG